MSGAALSWQKTRAVRQLLAARARAMALWCWALERETGVETGGRQGWAADARYWLGRAAELRGGPGGVP